MDGANGTDRQQQALQNILRYILVVPDAMACLTCDVFFASAMCRMLLKDIKHHSHSWPFLDPVDTDEVGILFCAVLGS